MNQSINHLLKISKKRYYKQYLLDNITDGKKLWKGIKQIVQFKPNTNKKRVSSLHSWLVPCQIAVGSFGRIFT